MELIMEHSKWLPCTLMQFEINGLIADIDDFGVSQDIDKEHADPYCCSCRKFIPDFTKREEAMRTYNISLEEFLEICEKLSEILDVGKCCLCI